MPPTFPFKSIIAYFNDPECNNPTEDDGEWVINASITFDYPMSVDLSKSTDDTSLYIPLSIFSVTSTLVENSEVSVFVVSPSKMNQSPIVFRRIQPRIFVIKDSSSDPEPTQFFLYARSTHHMLRRMGYNLQYGNVLNFRRGCVVFYGLSCQKGSQQIIMIKHAGVRIYYTSWSISV